jgi:AAA+ ATPase superfamily predicted ATPase
MNVSMDVIETVVNILNGVPGWLTFFGNEYIGGTRDLSKIKRLAVELALEELRNLVKERGERYAIALKGLAEGANSWGRLKRYIEEKE